MSGKLPKIHVPEGVNENGIVEELNNATASALVSLPILLQAIVEELSDLNVSLSWIERAAFLRAQSEGLFTPDEVERHNSEIEGADDEEPGDE